MGTHLTGVPALALQVVPHLHVIDMAPLLARAVQGGREHAPMVDPARLVELARTHR